MVQDVFLMMVVSRGKNKHVRGSKLENVYIEFQIEKHFWIRIYCSLCLKSLGLGDWLCTQGLQLLDDHATSCMCSICTNMYQLEKKQNLVKRTVHVVCLVGVKLASCFFNFGNMITEAPAHQNLESAMAVLPRQQNLMAGWNVPRMAA
jgi:hypothetical protein